MQRRRTGLTRRVETINPVGNDDWTLLGPTELLGVITDKGVKDVLVLNEGSSASYTFNASRVELAAAVHKNGPTALVSLDNETPLPINTLDDNDGLFFKNVYTWNQLDQSVLHVMHIRVDKQGGAEKNDFVIGGVNLYGSPGDPDAPEPEAPPLTTTKTPAPSTPHSPSNAPTTSSTPTNTPLPSSHVPSQSEASHSSIATTTSSNVSAVSPEPTPTSSVQPRVIAAAVSVTIVALLAIGTALFYIFRRRRNRRALGAGTLSDPRMSNAFDPLAGTSVRTGATGSWYQRGPSSYNPDVATSGSSPVLSTTPAPFFVPAQEPASSSILAAGGAPASDKKSRIARQAAPGATNGQAQTRPPEGAITELYGAMQQAGFTVDTLFDQLRREQARTAAVDLDRVPSAAIVAPIGPPGYDDHGRR